MLIQIVEMRVAPRHRDTFLEAFRINCAGSRAEPGCLRFDLLSDPDDPDRFSVYEVFESEEALEDHRRTKHYRLCIDMINPITSDRSRRLMNAEIVEGRAATVA